jgi:exopolysaccharide production protein ExoQ
MPAGASRVPTWIRDDGSPFLVAAIVWLAFLRGVIPGFFDYTSDVKQLIESGGSVGNQIIFASLVLIPMLLLKSRLKLTWMFLRSLDGIFILWLLYACASTLWSIDAGETVRRLLHLFGIYIVCATVCLVGWHARRFQQVMRPVITVLCVGSLIFGVLRPDLAIMPPNLAAGDPGGNWNGLANHKNGLGAVASFGAILWFHAFLYRDAKWWAIVVGMTSSVACLYLSGSSTSEVATLAVILFLLVGKLTPPSMQSRVTPVVIAVFLIITAAYGLAVMQVVPGLDSLVSSVTSAVGKNSTLSGRAAIWALMKAHIAQQPLIGTGYEAYWTGPFDTSPSYEFIRRLNFYPGEAHNGYLDIVNDLGYIGLVLLAGFVVRYFVLSIRLLKVDRPQALLYLGIMFYFLVSNLAESTWLTAGPHWMVLSIAFLSMSRTQLDLKLRSAVGSPQPVMPVVPDAHPDTPASRLRGRTRNSIRRRV